MSYVLLRRTPFEPHSSAPRKTSEAGSVSGRPERSRLAGLGARMRAVLPRSKDKAQATEAADDEKVFHIFRFDLRTISTNNSIPKLFFFPLRLFFIPFRYLQFFRSIPLHPDT